MVYSKECAQAQQRARSYFYPGDIMHDGYGSVRINGCQVMVRGLHFSIASGIL